MESYEAGNDNQALMYRAWAVPWAAVLGRTTVMHNSIHIFDHRLACRLGNNPKCVSGLGWVDDEGAKINTSCYYLKENVAPVPCYDEQKKVAKYVARGNYLT